MLAKYPTTELYFLHTCGLNLTISCVLVPGEPKSKDLNHLLLWGRYDERSTQQHPGSLPWLENPPNSGHSLWERDGGAGPCIVGI